MDPPVVNPATTTLPSADPDEENTVEGAIRRLIRANSKTEDWQEAAHKEIQEQRQTLNTLKDTLTRMERLMMTRTPRIDSTVPSPSIPGTPLPTLPVLQVTPTTSSQHTDLKPNTPPSYNGNRANGRNFLNSCNAYYRLRAKGAANLKDLMCRPDAVQDRIHWMLTFMNSDRAGKWANRIYNFEVDHPGQTYFQDWEAFVTEFKKEFYPLHPELQAINQLESDSYHQGNQDLDDYIDEFRDLANEAKYSDQRVLVIKFRRGLKAKIQDEIATMSSGRPSDDDLDGWIKQARLVEQNWSSNSAFKSASSTPRTSAPVKRSAPAQQGPAASFFPSNSSRPFNNYLRPVNSTPSPSSSINPSSKSDTSNPAWAHQTPTSGNPVSMDIDAARRRQELPPVCHRCGKPGHLRAQCPVRHDVRLMSADEALVHLESILARSNTPAPPEPTVTPISADSEPNEDFLSSSE